MESKTWFKNDAPSPELTSETPGKLAHDQTSAKSPDICKRMIEVKQSWLEAGIQCPSTSKSLQSDLKLLLWHRTRAALRWEQQCLFTHLNGWHMLEQLSFLLPAYCVFVPYALSAEQRNSKVKFTSAGFTFWKVQIQMSFTDWLSPYVLNETHLWCTWWNYRRYMGQ